MVCINFKIKKLLPVVTAISVAAFGTFCVSAYKKTIVVIEETKREQKNNQNIETKEKDKNKKAKESVSDMANELVLLSLVTKRIAKNGHFIDLPIDASIEHAEKIYTSKNDLPDSIKEKLEKEKSKNKEMPLTKMIQIEFACDTEGLDDSLKDKIKKTIKDSKKIKKEINKLKSDIMGGKITKKELEEAKEEAISISKIMKVKKTSENKNSKTVNKLSFDSVTMDSLKETIQNKQWTILDGKYKNLITIDSEENENASHN